MSDLVPHEIKERLQEQFNCKVKQVPRGHYNYIEVDTKEKIGLKMLFFFIPYHDYKISKKKIYFTGYYTLSSNYYHLNRREESNVETALDLDNMTLYWRYGN